MTSKDESYVTPTISVLGGVANLTQDGNVIKVGNLFDVFTGVNQNVTGSIVNVNVPG